MQDGSLLNIVKLLTTSQVAAILAKIEEVDPTLFSKLVKLRNGHCSRLSLRGVQLGRGAAALIATLVAHNTSIQELLLEKNLIKDEGVACISSALRFHRSLATFSCSSNQITHVGGWFLSEMLKSNHFLRCLSVGHNSLCEKGAAAIADAIQKNTSLAALNIQAAEFDGAGTAHMLRAMASNKGLRMLNVAHNGWNSSCVQALKQLAAWNNRLVSLNLSGCEIGRESSQQSLHALSSCRGLACVNLSACGFVEADACALRDCLRRSNIRWLMCDANSLGDVGLSEIVSAIPDSKLKKLSLRNIACSATGLLHLTHSLANCDCTLSFLDLSLNCFCGLSQENKRDSMPICIPLCLSTLYMQQCELNETDISALSTAISSCNLAWFYGCRLTNEATSRLQTNSQMLAEFLDACRMDDVATIQVLVQTGVHIDCCLGPGLETPFHIAVGSQSRASVELLTSSGVDSKCPRLRADCVPVTSAHSCCVQQREWDSIAANKAT